ncbi:MAG: hypothetical protein WCJ75_17515 [Desulfomonile sp.]
MIQICSNEQWDVLNWRFTVFFDNVHNPFLGDEEFLRFFGREHVEKSENRSDSTSSFSLSDGVSRSEMTINPGKIDFIISAALSFNPSSEKALTISEIRNGSAIFEAFQTSALNLVHGRSGISRIGIGAEHVFLVKCHEEAYSVLNEKMSSVQLDGARSSDFLYQINRWRNFEIGNNQLRINRLSKFACRKLGVAIESKSGEKSELEVYFASVSSDVNTDFRFDLEVLNPAERLEITRNLFEYSMEIGLKGETP